MDKMIKKNGLRLTNAQLQIAINQHIEENRGIQELIKMSLNALMVSERNIFLENDKNPKNRANGYRQIKKTGIGSKIKLDIPRDRLGIFKPLILGILKENNQRIEDLCFGMYTKGLTTREIEKIIKPVYGDGYSKSSVSRITTDAFKLVQAWLNRSLNKRYPVIFIDAIYTKVRRHDKVENEANYIILGLTEDFKREILSIVNIPNESAFGWEIVLKGIKERGVKNVDLFVFDGLIGLDNVVSKAFPKSLQQNCVIHFQRNLSKQVRLSDRKEFCNDLKNVFKPDSENYTMKEGIKNLKETLKKWYKKYPKFKKICEEPNKLENIFTYLKFDKSVRRMIYTTNWIERINKSFRRTLKIRNALPSPEAMITLLGCVAMDMEESVYNYQVSAFKNDGILSK